MESVPLDMDDLFDREDEPNDLGALDENEPVEPFPDEGGEGEEGEGNHDVTSKLTELAKGAKKQRTLKPQPKLDPDRLRSERGLPVIPKLFEDFKFRGKGHEAEDLNRVMGKLEHWAHRLFPQLTFDDFIDRLEVLGKKNQTKTTVKRIRNDMPILDSDFVTDPDNVNDGAPADTDVPPDDEIDMLLQTERDLEDSMTSQNPFPDSDEDASQTRPEVATPAAKPAPPTTSTPAPTAEQKARMERNKRMAMEKLKARLAAGPAPTLSAPGGDDDDLILEMSDEQPPAVTSHKNVTAAPGEDDDDLILEMSDEQVTGVAPAPTPVTSQRTEPPAEEMSEDMGEVTSQSDTQRDDAIRTGDHELQAGLSQDGSSQQEALPLETPQQPDPESSEQEPVQQDASNAAAAPGDTQDIDTSQEQSVDKRTADHPEHVTPRPADHVTPRSADHVTPRAADHVSPRSADHVTPHSADHVTPRSADHVTPRSADHVTPRSADHVTPRSADHVTPCSAGSARAASNSSMELNLMLEVSGSEQSGDMGTD